MVHNGVDNLIEKYGLLDAIEEEIEQHEYGEVLYERPLQHVPKSRSVHDVISRIEHGDVDFETVHLHVTTISPQVLNILT